MTVSRREGEKKLETVPIVPQMLITPPEIFLTWKLCLGRNREWDQGGIDPGTLGQKPGIQVLRHIKIPEIANVMKTATQMYFKSNRVKTF